MNRLNQLLMNRQYYLKRKRELKASVIHNNYTKKQLIYIEAMIQELEKKIKEELDNEL